MRALIDLGNDRGHSLLSYSYAHYEYRSSSLIIAHRIPFIMVGIALLGAGIFASEGES